MALAALYKALNDHHVFLEGTLIKPNMVSLSNINKIKKDINKNDGILLENASTKSLSLHDILSNLTL